MTFLKSQTNIHNTNRQQDAEILFAKLGINVLKIVLNKLQGERMNIQTVYEKLGTAVYIKTIYIKETLIENNICTCRQSPICIVMAEKPPKNGGVR